MREVIAILIQATVIIFLLHFVKDDTVVEYRCHIPDVTIYHKNEFDLPWNVHTTFIDFESKDLCYQTQREMVGNEN